MVTDASVRLSASMGFALDVIVRGVKRPWSVGALVTMPIPTLLPAMMRLCRSASAAQGALQAVAPQKSLQPVAVAVREAR